MAAGRRGMNCVCTFEFLQNIDRNTVVMQFKSKRIRVYQWIPWSVVFLIDFVAITRNCIFLRPGSCCAVM